MTCAFKKKMKRVKNAAIVALTESVLPKTLTQLCPNATLFFARRARYLRKHEFLDPIAPSFAVAGWEMDQFSIAVNRAISRPPLSVSTRSMARYLNKKCRIKESRFDIPAKINDTFTIVSSWIPKQKVHQHLESRIIFVTTLDFSPLPLSHTRHFWVLFVLNRLWMLL